MHRHMHAHVHMRARAQAHTHTHTQASTLSIEIFSKRKAQTDMEQFRPLSLIARLKAPRDRISARASHTVSV